MTLNFGRDAFSRRYGWLRDSSRPEAKECLFLAEQIDDIWHKCEPDVTDLVITTFHSVSTSCSPTWFDSAPTCIDLHLRYLEACKDYLSDSTEREKITLSSAALALYNLVDATVHPSMREISE